ncbi:MAG: zf-HC2 domain-containing protein [Candidatus Eremiobacteraeota bacterium]|nr:zf-HC2 domain-containing protein [Candidatus Eremiobacteraeota bacterium]
MGALLMKGNCARDSLDKGPNADMTCHDCRPLLMDYAHHELDDAQDALVHEHLQTCTECRAALQAEVDLTDSIRYAYSEELEMPQSIVAGVRQAVRGYSPSFSERVRTALRPALLAPAAAIALILAGALRYGPMLLTPPSSQLSSSYFVRQHVAQTLGSPSSDRSWAAYVLTSENAKSSQPSGQ